MFGRVINLDQNQVINTDYTDKCSYVPDSIPSRVFSFTMNNYNQIYNIDNPENGYINLDRNTVILMRNGYNIFLLCFIICFIHLEVERIRSLFIMGKICLVS